jgi:hypothetical protein
MKRYGTKSIVLVMVILGIALPAFGQQRTGAEGASATLSDLSIDVANLQEGVPMRVEDAYTLPEDAWDSRVSLAWGNQNNWFEERVELARGFANNYDATVGLIHKDNRENASGSGDVYLKLMHTLLKTNSSASLLGVQFNFPTGKDYDRIDNSVPPFALPVNEREDLVDTTLIGVYTKILGSEQTQRVHIETKYTFVKSAPAGFFSSRWFLGLGYDQRYNDRTLKMASIWWEEGRSKWSHSGGAAQFGLRHRVSDRFLWGASLDLGMNWPAANWGLTWGAEYGL